MTDQEDKTEEIRQNIMRNWLALDFARDPEEASAIWGTRTSDKAFFQNLLQQYHEAIAEKVAMETDSTIEEVLNAEKRTEKQDSLLLQKYAVDMESRIHKYFSSRHFEAMQTLKTDSLDEKGAVLAKLAIQYFFATLPPSTPGITETGILTKEEKDTLKGVFKRIKTFEKNHSMENLTRFFIEFIDSEILPPQAQKEIIERVKIIPTDKLLQPLDKPNIKFWDLVKEAANHEGQLTLDISTASDQDKKKGKDPIVYLALTFDNIPPEMHITKKDLTAYDKRVYIALGALWYAGNRTVTVSQIYNMMGNLKRPNSTDTKKINDSLTKMGFARLYIDSTEETKIHKGYTGFKDDAPLLAFKRRAAYINGQLVESAINLLDEPILIKFSRERKQVQQIPLQLLTTPVSQSNRNLEIEDYLLTRIGRMKSPKGNAQRKILYESIFTHCQIEKLSGKTREKARARTKETILKLLDYYKEIQFITEYKEEENGISINP